MIMRSKHVNEGEILNRIYTDLFPRMGKHSRPADFKGCLAYVMIHAVLSDIEKAVFSLHYGIFTSWTYTQFEDMPKLLQDEGFSDMSKERISEIFRGTMAKLRLSVNGADILKNGLLDLSVDKLVISSSHFIIDELSYRTAHALIRALKSDEPHTLETLAIRYTTSQVLSFRGVGKGTLDEIITAMAKYGLEFKE